MTRGGVWNDAGFVSYHDAEDALRSAHGCRRVIRDADARKAAASSS
jgi:hypothetical protein